MVGTINRNAIGKRLFAGVLLLATSSWRWL
jgi:hypothetical protein